MTVLWKLLRILAAVYVLLVLAMWLFQRRLQYFPDSEDPPAPPVVEDVTLRAADGTPLRAWYWPGTRGATLLLLHGNAGNRADRLPWMGPLHDLGWGVLLLDYRGYGGSGGAPTEEGLVADAEAAAAWLEAHGAGKLAYFGESLGCGVAVALAARRPPAALLLQSGADSLVHVAQRAYPVFPIRLLMKDRFDAAAQIASVPAPLLSIHGTADELIPMAFGRALFDAAPGPKEWYPVEGAGHNDLVHRAGAAYYARVHAWLERTLS